MEEERDVLTAVARYCLGKRARRDDFQIRCEKSQPNLGEWLYLTKNGENQMRRFLTWDVEKFMPLLEAEKFSVFEMVCSYNRKIDDEEAQVREELRRKEQEKQGE